jgi:long-subunit acyl-CoA synthetase (AMP-forming)
VFKFHNTRPLPQARGDIGALPAGVLPFGAHVTSPLPPLPAPITPDSNATIMYTSGTTAHPKGVVSTHRNIMAALNMFAVFGLISGAID